MRESQASVLLGCFADVKGVGGGAVRGFNTAVGLASRGHSVSMLSLRKQATPTEVLSGIPVTYFSLDAGRAWRMPQLVRRRQLVEVLKQQVRRPDVLLAISPFFIPAARDVWPDVRIVYLFPCLLWRCIPMTWDRKPRWPARLNNWLVGREERAALDASDRVLVQAQSVVKDITSFHRIAESKVVIAPTGVRDLSLEVRRPRSQVRRELATPDDAVVALTVGRLDSNKNVSHLLHAVHRVNHPNLWLWVVGDGPLAERLQLEASTGVSAERIRFLGVRNDMADVYASADLLLHAARYDNFPNVYLEAMVSGLPIIGPRCEFPTVVSPLDDLITEGIHGQCYSLQETADLVEKLSELLRHPERIKEMGTAARERALAKFGWDRYVDAVEHSLTECFFTAT